MTLYEVNQVAYANLPKMTRAEIENKLPEVEEFVKNSGEGEYFILLNNDLHYYTVFVNKSSSINKLTSEVVKIAMELGTLKSIDVNEEMIEFWVQKGEVCDMYAFFNYTRGVIEV